jgi:hypothetical protein
MGVPGGRYGRGSKKTNLSHCQQSNIGHPVCTQLLYRLIWRIIIIIITINAIIDEELRGLYSSPSIVRVIKARRMRWAGHVARMGEVRGAYNILVGRPEGRRPLGRPRRRWEDNIEMDLREIGFVDVDWIDLAQDRDRWRAVVNTVMNLWVP